MNDQHVINTNVHKTATMEPYCIIMVKHDNNNNNNNNNNNTNNNNNNNYYYYYYYYNYNHYNHYNNYIRTNKTNSSVRAYRHIYRVESLRRALLPALNARKHQIPPKIPTQ